MNFLRKYLNDVKPNFEKGGKLHAFRSVFDGFETFLFVPNETSKTGTHIHDAIDSKRIMSIVVIALLPALLFGMYNVGFQNYKAAGTGRRYLYNGVPGEIGGCGDHAGSAGAYSGCGKGGCISSPDCRKACGGDGPFQRRQ